MKIILLKDIPRIGVKGAILDLATAYAMNSFVNKGLARMATNNDEKLAKEKVDKKKEVKDNEKDKSIQIFSKIEKDTNTAPLIIKKNIDDKGHFYAKLSKHDIVDAVFEVFKVSISESQISSDLSAIKSIGDYALELNASNKKYKILVKIIK